MVNLIMEKVVVKELIQQELNPENLKKELQQIIEGSCREDILKKYKVLKHKFGNEGASEKAAKKMYEALRKKARK